MKLLIIADGSKKIGYGHLVRSITIAKYLEKKGWDCSILTPNLNVFNLDFIEIKTFKVISREALKVIKGEKNKNKIFDLTIIDGYNFHSNFKISFYNISRKIMIIDDLAINKSKCDILLDHSPGRNISEYKKLVPKNCCILTGSKYIALRNNLLASNKLLNYKRKRKKIVLISLGSTDPDNTTFRALKFLFFLNLKIKIIVIMTKSSTNLIEINQLLKINKNKFEMFLNPTVKRLKQIYTQSDICIGSPGVGIWERIYFGIPNIILNPNKVQKHLSDFLKEKNIVKELKLNTNNFSLKAKLKFKNVLYNDFVHSRMILKGNSIVDGKGLYRIYEAIEKVCQYDR